MSPLPQKGKIVRKAKAGKGVAETGLESDHGPLAHTLARDFRIDPALARIITAWPNLPEAIKAGILALVQAVRGPGA
jgi:hypothetical protein